MADEKPRVEYVEYTHHGKKVKVRADLKSKHRKHCLCHHCAYFCPGSRKDNCHIANVLYEIDRAFGLVTPVWECPRFIPEQFMQPMKPM